VVMRSRAGHDAAIVHATVLVNKRRGSPPAPSLLF
jgi:hypothetical protein